MSGAPKKTVLVMCNNPTTDGPLEWEGHEMVMYVDITPAVTTQDDHKARLQATERELINNIAKTERDISTETDEDDVAELEGVLVTSQANLEVVRELLDIPLPVEHLSTIYRQGINAVPADLKVDVVLSAACPLGSRYPATFKPGSVHADLLAAVQRHLKPGGEFYFMGSWTSAHPSIQEAFSPLVDYVREETAYMGSRYYDARAGGFEQDYSVLVRKASGGRRKTYRRRPKRRLTKKRK